TAVVTRMWTPRPLGQPRPGRGVVGRWSWTGSYLRGRCSMLELLASNGARAVLRGGGTGDSASLPDARYALTGEVRGDFLMNSLSATEANGVSCDCLSAT